MKLSRLAQLSGVSTTTIKHWIRVGIMPAGHKRNATSAVYGERHLGRARLLLVLRDVYGASVASIRSLTDVLDKPDVLTSEVLAACQSFAFGASDEYETEERLDEFRERTHRLMRRRDWRGYPGAAERGLTLALAQAAEVGVDYDDDELMEYADVLEPLAVRNIAALAPYDCPEGVARRMLLAVNARARQLVALSSLAHTAVSIRAVGDRGWPNPG